MLCPLVQRIEAINNCSPIGVSVQYAHLDRWQGVAIDGWRSPLTMNRDHALSMAVAHVKVMMKRAARKTCCPGLTGSTN